MRETVGSLRKSPNSSRIEQDKLGKATFNGVPIYVRGSNTIKINDNVFDLAPEIHKALPSNGYD